MSAAVAAPTELNDSAKKTTRRRAESCCGRCAGRSKVRRLHQNRHSNASESVLKNKRRLKPEFLGLLVQLCHVKSDFVVCDDVAAAWSFSDSAPHHPLCRETPSRHTRCM